MCAPPDAAERADLRAFALMMESPCAGFCNSERYFAVGKGNDNRHAICCMGRKLTSLGGAMSSGLQRFLGDSLLRTVVKLAVLSFVVGVVLTALDLSVFDLVDRFVRLVRNIWEMG